MLDVASVFVAQLETVQRGTPRRTILCESFSFRTRSMTSEECFESSGEDQTDWA